MILFSLLSFQAAISEVSLQPSQEAGTFKITVNGHLVFDRKVEQCFPEAKEVKQLVRDIIQPGLDLGHSDRKKENEQESTTMVEKADIAVENKTTEECKTCPQ